MKVNNSDPIRFPLCNLCDSWLNGIESWSWLRLFRAARSAHFAIRTACPRAGSRPGRLGGLASLGDVILQHAVDGHLDLTRWQTMSQEFHSPSGFFAARRPAGGRAVCVLRRQAAWGASRRISPRQPSAGCRRRASSFSCTWKQTGHCVRSTGPDAMCRRTPAIAALRRIGGPAPLGVEAVIFIAGRWSRGNRSARRRLRSRRRPSGCRRP